MRITTVMLILTCLFSGCKKDLNSSCDAFNHMVLMGPAVAYIDSSFTLTATSMDDIGYEWDNDQFTSSITGTSTITIDPVYPGDSGDYRLTLMGYDCGNRLLTHHVEVRPKPFGNSPCNTTNNTAKLAGSSYTITNRSGQSDGSQYKTRAYGSYYEVDITLPLSSAPTADQVFYISQSEVTYNTAEVTISGGAGFACYYYPTTGGKLYVKKTATGVEYSFCGLAVVSDGGCTGTSISTTADVKFTIP